MNTLKTEQINSHEINPNEIVTLYVTPYRTTVVASKHSPGKNYTKKLNGETYVNRSTNKICNYKTEGHKNRSGLKRTLNRFKLLLGNFNGDPNEAMITLTYKDFMDDQKRISLDILKFVRHLKYTLPNTTKYLFIREPDKKGSWHIHFMIKVPSFEVLKLDENEIRKAWDGDGYEVSIEPIYDVDGLKNYLDCFLNSKKSDRLSYYYALDSNIKLFGHSRNVIYLRYRGPYEGFTDYIVGGTLLSKNCYDLKNNNHTLNTIQYEFYKNNEEVDYHA